MTVDACARLERRYRLFLSVLSLVFALSILAAGTARADSDSGSDSDSDSDSDSGLDVELRLVLEQAGFTGELESTLEARLGRPIDPALADLGRLLFFDEVLSLRDDNACAGCHTPAFGFGDPQSIAYGVANNRIVGPNRDGTRNERKAPVLTNVGFYPKLMVNGRFAADSGDPFDNSQGFSFPPPNDTRFGPNDPLVPNLLTAQAFLPVPSLVEMAGFQGTAGTIDPRFDPFDDGVGTPVPGPDTSGSREDPIRDLTVARLEAIPGYRARFDALFGTGPIVFEWVGQALAEFQIALVAADAPIDRFARGDDDAMSSAEKRGALLFFGQAGCAGCHVGETFSDFENRVVGVPQIHPEFGVGLSNIVFDGPGEDEDFGAFRITGDPADRYAFRTSPLRNVAVQPAFFHNGAFTRLEDAVRHHLDVFGSALDYDPVAAGVDEDLHFQGPIGPVLAAVDPLLSSPIVLSDDEVEDLVTFVRDGLLDPKALPEELCALVPAAVPSGRPLPEFEGCETVNVCHKGKKTKTVSRSALAAHLGHGDTRGSC